MQENPGKIKKWRPLRFTCGFAYQVGRFSSPPSKVVPSNIFSSSELFSTLSLPFQPPCISYSRWSFKLNQQGKHSRTIGYGKNQHYHVRLFWWTVSFNDKYLIFRATAIYLTQPPSGFAQCVLLPAFLLGVFLLF